MNDFTGIFNQLVQSGPRLPWLENFLLDVWSPQHYAQTTPLEYLRHGETDITELEELISAAAEGIYKELAGAPTPERDVATLLTARRPSAVVIFDGLSLRELPLILQLAEESKLNVTCCSLTTAALPSETVDFIAQRLKIAPIAPSQLPNRSELKNQGITAYYYDSPTRVYEIDDNAAALLLWSAFPDVTYKDSGARFEKHFEHIHEIFRTAWMKTVQKIPAHREILITSDHGYAYFGSGFAAGRSSNELAPLNRVFGGSRHVKLSALPAELCEHDDIFLLPERDLAMIKGKVQLHPPGEAGRKLYKHGGMSLMEMLVPWVVLQ